MIAVSLLLGYANEVGEAFRSLIPVRLVHLSYLVASLYVLSHAFFCGSVASKSQKNKGTSNLDFHDIETTSRATFKLETTSPVVTVADTLVWQGLASVAIPGLVINRTCALSRVILNLGFKTKLSGPAKGYTVTLIGLCAIPCIIKPIDR